MEMTEIAKLPSKEALTEVSSENVEEEILKPGTKIKPEVTEEEIRKLAERLYGIVTLEMVELISYDDRNFLIHEDRNIKNPLIVKDWPHGYVMKILNALDSRKSDFIDAQTKLMIFLEQQGIKCPRPVENVYGKFYSIEKLGNSRHIVRLLRYIPGKNLYEVPTSDNLFYQVGEFVANFDRAVKHFHHDAYKTHKTLWMLESVPRLKEFLYALKDESKQEIVEQVMAAFDKKVMNKLAKFEPGLIHGDFNEHNILMSKEPNTSDTKEYRVSGILDFGDTCYSHLVFELAIAMTYMMVQTRLIATGGLVLAGYSSVRLVPAHERKVLKICIAARLCQSLVLGMYTHSLDPDNEYILTTQKHGWTLLESLWSQPDDVINEMWNRTADDYLTRSEK